MTKAICIALAIFATTFATANAAGAHAAAYDSSIPRTNTANSAAAIYMRISNRIEARRLMRRCESKYRKSGAPIIDCYLSTVSYEH
jgi:methionine-rich copper-binding protein CopC